MDWGGVLSEKRHEKSKHFYFEITRVFILR